MDPFFSIINNLITKDIFSISLAIIAIFMSIVSFTIRKRHHNEIDSLIKEILIESEKARLRSQYLPDDEKHKLIKKIAGIEKVIQDYHEGKLEKKPEKGLSANESGFITQDFFLYAVPAIIALTFTFVLVYLLIVNQANQNYQSPDVLKTGLSTIIGYYFGVTVKEKSNSASVPSIENLTPDDVKRMISETINST